MWLAVKEQENTRNGEKERDRKKKKKMKDKKGTKDEVNADKNKRAQQKPMKTQRRVTIVQTSMAIQSEHKAKEHGDD